MNDADLATRIYDFLTRHNVLNLAYNDGGSSQACALWFVADRDLSCYFLSAFSTRHGRALRAGAQVAFTVQKDEQSWQSIRGIQGRGYCEPVQTSALEQAVWQLYTDRFPFVTEQIPDLQAAMSQTALWRLIPFWIRLIDNRRGFGHKEELLLDES